jgi:hypothetical protein
MNNLTELNNSTQQPIKTIQSRCNSFVTRSAVEVLDEPCVSSRAFDSKRRTASGSQVFLNPKIEIVKTYFREQNFPELEAQKFFNFFSSIDWLVGGKTPMANWQASAQNWMLNSSQFNPNTKPKALHYNATNNNEKNYGEPL